MKTGHRLVVPALIASFFAAAPAQAQQFPLELRLVFEEAAADSVLAFHPGQGGQESPSSGWCRRWNPCLRGGAIGLLVGAGVGAIIGLASGDDAPGTFLGLTAGEKAALGAAVFGVVGAVIGYAIASSGEHDRLLISVGPLRDGRFGLGLSVRV